MDTQWSDPFPTAAELMDRQMSMQLVHLLIGFARDHGDLRDGLKAEELADKITAGFGVLNDMARTRLRSAETALQDIRLAMPPAPIVVGDKLMTYCPPEAEQRHMYNLIRQAVDRYEAANKPAPIPEAS